MSENLKTCSCRDGQRIRFKMCDGCGGMLLYDDNIVEQLSEMFEGMELMEESLQGFMDLTKGMDGGKASQIRQHGHNAILLSHLMRTGQEPE